MKTLDNSSREKIAVNVAGHEVRLEIEPEEKVHVEKAAAQVAERMRKLTERMATASPQKIATMVAFQFACDLNIANDCLDEAEQLHHELQRQREAVKRLEGLLAKVDNALAV